MSQELRHRLLEELDSLVLIDPHTHIEATNPASQTLADILGYHYYTELAHSAGLSRDRIEDPMLSAKEKVQLLIENLGPIENTIQWSWFIELSQKLFGHQADYVDASNWEALYDSAESQMAAPDYVDTVLAKSKLEAVFLTNDFDDALEGFDTTKYIPCLRTDDLVFHLAKPEVRARLEKASQCSVTSVSSLKQAIATLFYNFKSKNARACAISLPPDFSPAPVTEGRARTAIEAILKDGLGAAESHRKAIAGFVFWLLADMCAQHKLPFDLMIGVNRAVYPAGVHQGRDLYDSRVSLIQYKELFNSFPQVKFPVSVLASVTNQELVSYAWIFPNVITSGHWWYSNTPTYIEHDLSARLEAVPRTKQIGYYSDMYKLEFGLPKFAMYKRCLAKVLAERYVIDRGWSEERAVALGKQLLRGNVEDIFRFNEDPAADLEGIEAPWNDRSLVNPGLTPPELLVVQPPADDEDMPFAPMGGAAIAAGATWGVTNFTGEQVVAPPADDGEEFGILDDAVPTEEGSAGIGSSSPEAAPAASEENWFNSPVEESVDDLPAQETQFDLTPAEDDFAPAQLSDDASLPSPAEPSPWGFEPSADPETESSRVTQPFNFGNFGDETANPPTSDVEPLEPMELGSEPIMDAPEEISLTPTDDDFGTLEALGDPQPEPAPVELPPDEAFPAEDAPLELPAEPTTDIPASDEMSFESLSDEPLDLASMELGEVSESEAESIEPMVEAAASDEEPFTLEAFEDTDAPLELTDFNEEPTAEATIADMSFADMAVEEPAAEQAVDEEAIDQLQLEEAVEEDIELTLDDVTPAEELGSADEADIIAFEDETPDEDSKPKSGSGGMFDFLGDDK